MQTSISEGNFYEAEQMCRTLHCRFRCSLELLRLDSCGYSNRFLA